MGSEYHAITQGQHHSIWLFIMYLHIKLAYCKITVNNFLFIVLLFPLKDLVVKVLVDLYLAKF